MEPASTEMEPASTEMEPASTEDLPTTSEPDEDEGLRQSAEHAVVAARWYSGWRPVWVPGETHGASLTYMLPAGARRMSACGEREQAIHPLHTARGATSRPGTPPGGKRPCAIVHMQTPTRP